MQWSAIISALSHKLLTIRSARFVSSSFTARTPICVADSTPVFRAMRLSASSVKASRNNSFLVFLSPRIGSSCGRVMDSRSAACHAKSSSCAISVRVHLHPGSRSSPFELTTLAPTMASADFVPVAVRVRYYGRAQTKAAAMAWVDEAHIRPHPFPACLRMYG